MTLVCEFCGGEFERPNPRGPKPKYCSHSHRQLEYLKRQSALAYEQGRADGRAEAMA